ncbi:hook-length control protein FliK [Modicisalibacter muralis]|uniref:Hook-length control protein FliK n=1 Tax=Modicisalibacter muralis TaxID=119000 RepID=A0A1G9FY80_9GAMM|nr:flagellar hook-length control protein FliK [Halomonas muralis]SDK93332.1 hook-length control protein FliK [Halomonas muralis]
MSGITPILDTLLHQVLGKRVDTPPPRELLEPVKPLTPGVAPRAVQGDSQLDAGRAGVANSRLGVGEPAARQALPTPPVFTPTSTTTHFSSAALTIADILVKFPAPPSVIQSPVPLLQSDVPNNPPLLAARLQHSIESSGLFYESHLARWYRGEMSRAALEREPQMWRFQSLQPLPGGKTGPGNVDLAGLVPGARGRGGEHFNPLNSLSSLNPKASGDNAGALGNPISGRATSAQGNAALPASATTPVHPSASSGQGMSTTPPAFEAGETTLRLPALEAIDDTLQGIIRHQLELLVTPTLRWEGDIWSGLFMALSLQLPEVLDERDWHGEEERKEGDDDPVWHSQLSLRLPKLGELDVQMHLRNASVNLTLQSGNEECLAVLEAGREDLVSRLRRCGLDDVRVSVLPVRDDEPWENEP